MVSKKLIEWALTPISELNFAKIGSCRSKTFCRLSSSSFQNLIINIFKLANYHFSKTFLPFFLFLHFIFLFFFSRKNFPSEASESVEATDIKETFVLETFVETVTFEDSVVNFIAQYFPTK